MKTNSRSMYLLVLSSGPNSGQGVQQAERVKVGTMPCNGEAHSNGHIDHCMVCLGGTWGEMDVYGPVDLEKARKENLVVAFNDLTHEQQIAFLKDQNVKLESVSKIRRKNGYTCASWSVVIPETIPDYLLTATPRPV